MRFPLSLTTAMVGYIAKNKIRRNKRFPLVLMLEPLARLQPHLHRLRPHPRIRIDDQGKAYRSRNAWAPSMSAAPRSCSICGGEPMIYPEIGRLVHDILTRRKHIYPVHQRHVHRETAARVQADHPLLLQRPSRRPEGNARSGRGARRRVRGGGRGHRRRQARRLPRLHQHDDLQGNRPRRDRRTVRLSDPAWRRRLHAVAGLRLHGGPATPTRSAPPRSS